MVAVVVKLPDTNALLNDAIGPLSVASPSNAPPTLTVTPVPVVRPVLRSTTIVVALVRETI